MPQVIANYLSNPPTFDQMDTLIDQAGLWEPMCVKDKSTPIRTGKKGAFIGTPDEHGGFPVLRCPSFFECKEIPEGLRSFFSSFHLDFNIVKIQKYITGVEGISPHTDKCLDMKRGHPIWIYRMNKEEDKVRSLCIREKEDKKSETRYKMEHNSLFQLEYEENQHLLHWVPYENDDDTTSECISFVLRRATTFRLPSGEIYGDAAKYKTYETRMKCKEPPIVIRDNYEDIVKMYSIENKRDIRDGKCKEYEEICEKIISETK